MFCFFQKSKQFLQSSIHAHWWNLALILGDNIDNQEVLETFQNILDIVNTCENLSADFVKEGKIEDAGDYLLDIQILKMSHDLLGSTADKMGNQDFSEEEFAAALSKIFTMDSGDQDFSKLTDIALQCSQSFQHSVSLLGAVDLGTLPGAEKVRKERQKQVKNNAPTKAPENVKQLSSNTKGAGKINNVRTEIQRICRERGSDMIPYFELICHPNDFMKSVDNAFQISFLVRDGFLGLKKSHGEPFVFLYDPDPESHHHSQRIKPSDTVQCVMSINPNLWREKVAKFKIRKPLLDFASEVDETGNAQNEMEVDSE